MSEQFAIGEVAIFWRPDCPNHQKEVTVASELMSFFGQDMWSGEIKIIHGYQVNSGPDWVEGPFSDGGGALVAPVYRLRKKRPPQELGSWEEIDRLTKWHPSRIFG